MDFEGNKKEESEILDTESAPKGLRDPALNKPNGEELPLLDTMATLSDKGEKKMWPKDLSEVMMRAIDNRIGAVGKLPTHDEIKKGLIEAFKFDTFTGEPLEPQLIEVTIERAMKYFDRKVKHLNES